ncbi:hypothetical protein A1O3_06631 [Capronia epimyces CBS 606.96]|uniref:FAS1 domain-containing protein n=1 Tax=Capronia epimyces CBS 606.96 TaxID=1182542 RepID=W9Y0Q3_9EURO|nr:uncharacterized protein A1O3_06631 [Capronia epimyces CBS 606.96]EXJ82816.1 hypothetical protein A1O3_06631 [Capronia epimyces CBS 606.96]
MTVLAPNDQAIAAFVTNNPNITSDDGAVRALLQYHLANGTHPSATFGLQPLFAHTLLNNASYANVTGGQVIEITTDSGKPAVVSGVKAVSHLLEADILYAGGLIHIVDSVLTIPISVPATITEAGLTDLIALLDKGGWLDPSSPAVTIINTLSDLSIFAPNNPQFGASFTGWDGLSDTDRLSILEYSISQSDTVIYSSNFRNNTKIATLDRISSTMTNVSGDFYVDSSLITTRDYLTSNGVLQVLDSPLNPNTTDARPSSVPTASSSKDSSGLSAAAGAGIGIGIGALVLGGALVVALYMRIKRRRRDPMAGSERLDGESRERVVHRSDPSEPPPTYELDTKSIVEGRPGATRTRVFEVHHPVKPPSPMEIDGIERSRISITIEGGAPRHLGFQARY